MKRTWFKFIVVAAIMMALVGFGATATAETALRPGYMGDIVHVVRWGDTLTGIADRYGTSPVLIINANKLRNPNQLFAGQRLVVPVRGYVSPGHTAPKPQHPAPVAQHPAPGGCIPYTIRPGDSTSSIAARFGVNELSLIQVNNLINPNYIHAGVTIRVCNVAHVPPAQVVWAPAPHVVVHPVVVGPPPGPPACNRTYVVKRNDTLFSVATAYNTSVQHLRNLNNLASDYIYVGQTLQVPCGWAPPAHPAKVEPPAPTLAPAMCNPSVAVSYPRENEYVSGIINIVGTANIPNFQFYKVEYGQGEVPYHYSSIGEVMRVQKTGTTLVTWDTATVPNGVYLLRLTAVENSGQFPLPCDVRIVVDN